mgnify:CR=1 FL=1
MDATESELTNAQIYARLLKQVRLIRTEHNITVAEAIQRFGGPGIDDEYRRIVASLHSESGHETAGK